MAGAEHDELWNLILLQSEAIQTRLREFHQQVEAYIQSTGENPLTGEKQAAAHDGAIPARERTTATTWTPLTSDFTAQITRDMCDAHGCIRDTQTMLQFIKVISEEAITIEDKAQILFVLDSTFTSTAAAAGSGRGNGMTSNALWSVFEKERGYETVVGWFTHACTYEDEASKTFSRLLLQFFTKHKPALPYARKTVLIKLRSMQSLAIGRKTKSMIRDTCDKYRE